MSSVNSNDQRLLCRVGAILGRIIIDVYIVVVVVVAARHALHAGCEKRFT